MKRIIFTLLVVLGGLFANAQVVINDGIRDIDNNSYCIATPESLSSTKIVAKLKLKNTSNSVADFAISADKTESVEGATDEIYIDGVLYNGTSTTLAAGEMKDVEFVVNSPSFGATKITYTIKGSKDYVINIRFYYTSLNFAESHHETIGDNLNSTQRAGNLKVNVPADSMATLYFNFKNIGETADYFLKQSFIKSVKDFDNMICMPGQCVTGNTTPPFAINKGETIEQTHSVGNLGMDVICYPNEVEDNAIVKYSLIKGSVAAPTADSISWVVEYNSRPVGISKPGNNNSVAKFSNIYPNPVKNVININCSGVEGVAALAIYNMTGQKVMEYEAETYSGKISLNVADLKNGLYLYSISLNGKTVESKKFVISR